MIPGLGEGIAIAALVLAAAALRGFTGFGFALGAVPLLSLVIAPQRVVPVVMLLQVLASLQTLAREWRHVDWRTVGLLVPGSLAGLVPGLALLGAMSPAAARLAIGAIVGLAVAGLASGWRLPRFPGPLGILGLGGVTGLFNGLAAMPGPPVIFLYLASDRPPAVSRASMLFFFLVTGSAGAAAAALRGMLGGDELVLTALLAPPMVLGTWLGELLFRRLGGRGYRAIGTAILGGIALAAIAKALATLAAG
jgi:hypothetical protein